MLPIFNNNYANIIIIKTKKHNTLPRCTDDMCQQKQLTLNAFGQVAKVEDVVRLGWRRQEVQTHSAVDLIGSLHYGLGTLPYSGREFREKSVQYCLKHVNINKPSDTSEVLIL